MYTNKRMVGNRNENIHIKGMKKMNLTVRKTTKKLGYGMSVKHNNVEIEKERERARDKEMNDSWFW